MTDPLPYDNPLIGRYASKRDGRAWGPQRKFRTWRRLWLALAEAEAELGCSADDGKSPRIRAEQLDRVAYPPRRHRFRHGLPSTRSKLRHDVMAHIHALGDVAPGCRDDRPPRGDVLLRHRQRRPAS